MSFVIVSQSLARPRYLPSCYTEFKIADDTKMVRVQRSKWRSSDNFRLPYLCLVVRRLLVVHIRPGADQIRVIARSVLLPDPRYH